MASFCEEDGILRIPATSPCRRDYQLRSFSSTHLSELEISRPQSPWLPRSESRSELRSGSRSQSRSQSRSKSRPELPSEDVSTFRRYESTAESNCYSGSLRGAQQGVARSYYSGPLPSPSPLPSYFSGAALPGFIVTTADSFVSRAGTRAYHSRQLVDASFVSGRVPEISSSRDSSFRGEEGVSVADNVHDVRGDLYTSYVRKEDGRVTPRSSFMASPSPVNSVAEKQSSRVRNCVSGELGMRFEHAEQRALVSRGYKSGEIVGLEFRANGIYPSDVEALVKGGREISVRKQLSSESLLSQGLSDIEIYRPNYEKAMVAIPFKWEEMPGDSTKKSCSRTSLISRPAQIASEQKVASESQIGAANEHCVGNTHRFYGGATKGTESGRWSESVVRPAVPVAAKLAKSSSVSSVKPKLKPKNVVSSAVPFKWEVEPGKPKVEEKAKRSPEAAPALQLPPRLASTFSTKRNSWSVSAPSSRRNSSVSAATTNCARQPSRSLSASVATPSSVGKRSLQSQGEPHSPPQNGRRTLATVLRSIPMDNNARPSDFTSKRGASQSIPSQFGSPRYRSAEYLCEDSVSWNRVRSPTSTLCGPGSDSHSNPSSSDKSSRKSSVSFSHSQSGTSEESFEQWSYGDHISPTSRHPSIREFPESEGCFLRADSVRGDEEGDYTLDGTMSNLRRRLILKSSSSKPPVSPIRFSSLAAPAASRSVDANGYVSHGEEYFDCQGGGSSPSPSSHLKNVDLHFDTEEEAEVVPPTRLPYKMPSPAHDIEPKTVSVSSSPTRAGSEFTNCLALPRFLSRGETPTSWVENPSWDMPNAPTNTVEDGYRSPAYTATLELLSPSPNLMSKKSGSRRVSKLPRSSSSRRRHPHLVEVLCNSLKQSLQRCRKRTVASTQSIVLYDDQFTKRRQSFMW